MSGRCLNSNNYSPHSIPVIGLTIGSLTLLFDIHKMNTSSKFSYGT